MATLVSIHLEFAPVYMQMQARLHTESLPCNPKDYPSCVCVLFFLFFLESMKAKIKASSKKKHLIHYRSECRPLENRLWATSGADMPPNHLFISIHNDVIQKYCIQKVHKNAQFCNRKGYRYTAYRYTAVIYVILGAFA